MKPVAGVKVMSPVVASTTHEPSPGTSTDLPSSAMVLPAGDWVITTLVGSKSPSASVSLPTTVTTTALPVMPVPLSFTATGASFTGSTVMSRVVSSVLPSGSVTV